MNNETAIKILSKRNYMCGECPFSGPDCKGCRLAEALDLAIGALSTPEVPNNMTLIPTAVLDELTNISAGGLVRWKVDGALIACDSCGQILIKASKLYRYCPNCGAKMEAGTRWKEEEDEE